MTSVHPRKGYDRPIRETSGAQPAPRLLAASLLGGIAKNFGH
jgi:hypothetical protein